MILHLSNLANEPLNTQISRQIRAKILTGDLQAGVVLPSIRALAREYHVSVITVQKAYDDLVAQGLIYARAGRGYFIAQISAAKKTAKAKENLQDRLKPILTNGIAEGLNNKEIEDIIKDILRKKEGNK